MDPYGAVVGAVLGWIEAGGQQDLTEFQNAAAKRIAGYQNASRMAGNRAKAAMGNLARWSQSLSNQRHLQNAGEALNASQVNYRRAKDAGTRMGFGNLLKQDEQMGMMAAVAGASGTRGSVVDTITQATHLRQTMAQEAAKQSGEAKDYDARAQMKSIASQMIGGVNSSVILDNLDYGESVYKINKDVSRLHSAVMGAMKGAKDDYSNQFSPGDSDANKQVQQYESDVSDLSAKGRQQFQFNYAEQQKEAYENYSNEGKHYTSEIYSSDVSTKDSASVSSYWGME